MLNLHEMERLPPWIENMPVEARDKRDIQNAMQHQKKQGKKGNSQKVQREARINCKSKDVYMQINLNDLEAYTQDVLKNERDRQRLCWCRAIVVCLSLTVFPIGVGAAIMTEDIQSQIFDQLPKQYKNSIRVPPPPTGNNSNTNQTYSHNIAMENPAVASTATATATATPSASATEEKPAVSKTTATSSSNATSTTEENPRTSPDETATATTATTTPAVSQTEEKPAASTVTTYASNVSSEAHHQPQEQEPAPATATTTTTSPPASSSSSTSSPAHAQQQEAEEDPSYILSTCEREVNSNHSFSFLLQRIQSHDTDVPMCRPEVR